MRHRLRGIFRALCLTARIKARCSSAPEAGSASAARLAAYRSSVVPAAGRRRLLLPCRFPPSIPGTYVRLSSGSAGRSHSVVVSRGLAGSLGQGSSSALRQTFRGGVICRFRAHFKSIRGRSIRIDAPLPGYLSERAVHQNLQARLLPGYRIGVQASSCHRGCWSILLPGHTRTPGHRRRPVAVRVYPRLSCSPRPAPENTSSYRLSNAGSLSHS